MSNLYHLLEIEENNRLWQTEIDNLHLWAAIRTTVLSTYLYRKFHHTKPHSRNTGIKSLLSPSKWGNYATFLRFLLSSEKYNALIFKDINTKIGDKDRIFGEYIRQLDNSLIFETNFTNHKVNDAYTEDMLRAWILLHSRLRSFPEVQKQEIDKFASRVASLFDMPDIQAELAMRIRRFLGSYPSFYKFVKNRLLPRMDSRIAFVHAASYSNHYALIARVLHDAEVKVIEIQHGTIHNEHYAYQLPESCKESNHPCHVYLPDVMLTFGEYWNSVAAVPYPCVTIGYPYLSQIVEQATQKFPETTTKFLVVSQGIVTEKMVALTHQLAEKYPAENIIFKLHPSEINFKERYESLNSIKNVRVIGQGNVYELIAQCEIVVGYSSTVLYEALAFPEKRIFIEENDSVDAPIGTYFTDADDLLKKLSNENAGYSDITPDMFWSKNWEENLSAFLASQPV